LFMICLREIIRSFTYNFQVSYHRIYSFVSSSKVSKVMPCV
jgi:hypothetical protein